MTTSTMHALLTDTAKTIGNLPNLVTMSDGRALRFADLSSAMSLTAVYLEDFRTTGCARAARKYLDLVSRVSGEISALAIGESREIGEWLVLAQRVCVEAHAQFQACVNAKLASNRSE